MPSESTIPDTAAPVAQVPSAAVDAMAIRFMLDGSVIEIEACAPTLTVLEYLREQLHRTGTKEGCAEGDCGACTVVVGELDQDAQVRYRAINSCIRFLPTLDGKELITVESLAARDGPLHPVQQALVDNHASQCGFCTPGFVMSLFALYQSTTSTDRETVLAALAGNLCRCTGYRPIIAAGCAMHAYPEPERWSRSTAHSQQTVAALRAMQRTQSLRQPGFYAPRNLDELAHEFAAHPEALLLAGGTDVALGVTKQLRELPALIYLGEVAELRRIEKDAAGLRIGAAVTLGDAWPAIVAEYPELDEVAQRFASPPIRNSGTLVGNLANGSPIGDAMPPLMALGASIQLRLGPHLREIALEDFYLGYQHKDLAPGEFVAAVVIPPRRTDVSLACYKLSKRIDQDISAVCAAFAVERDAAGIVAATLAFGGMAATPKRAAHTEAALIGRVWDEATFESASAELARDFTPLSDMRASAAYRLQSARNLLRRFFLEQAQAPLVRTQTAAVSIASSKSSTLPTT